MINNLNKCYICENYKNSEEFHKDKSRKNGRASKCKECSIDYGKVRLPYHREYEKNRLANNLNRRIENNLRKRLRDALHGNFKTGSAVRDLGCSINNFKIFFKNQFKPGMSWENYGEWHIDHIIPMNSFDLTNEEEIKKCCHYSNLQPLWAKDNLSKGKKLASWPI